MVRKISALIFIIFIMVLSLCSCNLFREYEGIDDTTTTTTTTMAATTTIGTIQSKGVLEGKKIVYDGDSICEGVYGGGGYAKIIAELTGSISVNQGRGGGTLGTQAGLDNGVHSVVDNLDNLPRDADLYCFQGGINDWWTYGVLGDYDENDFTGELDTSTV
ncbi:MAG: hypothetical protein IKY44_01445, partial [Clostridia bacterium]|nr:hypothetical protein [Clostridia bacterium]